MFKAYNILETCPDCYGTGYGCSRCRGLGHLIPKDACPALVMKRTYHDNVAIWKDGVEKWCYIGKHCGSCELSEDEIRKQVQERQDTIKRQSATSASSSLSDAEKEVLNGLINDYHKISGGTVPYIQFAARHAVPVPPKVDHVEAPLTYPKELKPSSKLSRLSFLIKPLIAVGCFIAGYFLFSVIVALVLSFI